MGLFTPHKDAGNPVTLCCVDGCALPAHPGDEIPHTYQVGQDKLIIIMPLCRAHYITYSKVFTGGEWDTYPRGTVFADVAPITIESGGKRLVLL